MDMTYDQFMAALARLADQRWGMGLADQGWEYDGAAIRLTNGYCPLVGVAQAAGFAVSGYRMAARVLGLATDDADAIADGADGFSAAPARQARADMLDALGLTETQA